MKWLIVILVIVTGFVGCSRWIAPAYTNVEKLNEIQIGMNLPQVTRVLGIEPYDIYFKGGSDFIVIYNYRVKDRLMEVSGDYHRTIHADISQSMGKEWYGKAYFCYVYFKDNQVKSLITDEGKLKSEDILVRNNNIYLIQEDQLGYYLENDSIIFVPMK